MTHTQKILLADDHTMFRESLILLLGEAFPHVEWHQAGSWHELPAILAKHPMDLALVDLNMPGTQPWPNEIRRLVKQFPDMKLCVLSATTSPEVIQSAFQLGIKGYIPKLVALEELQQAISLVLQGKTYLPTQLWEKPPSKTTYDKTLLTQRQQTILHLLAQGHSNKRISQVCTLAESTVKRHVYNIFQLLGANNRVETVKIARQRGLIN